MKNEVVAFDPTRRTSDRAVVDAAKLHWFGEAVLDMTYGRGVFWKLWQPAFLFANDLHADEPEIDEAMTGLRHRYQEDFTQLSGIGSIVWNDWPDDTMPTVVFDPDYRLNGTSDRGDRDKRHGVHLKKTTSERMEDIRMGARNAAILADESVVVKVQDQVSSQYMHRQTRLVNETIEGLGWRWTDQLYQVSDSTQPAGRDQQHARQNVSVWMLFRPQRRRKLWQ